MQFLTVFMKHFIRYSFLFLKHPNFESNFVYAPTPCIKEYSLVWELWENSELQLLSAVSHYYNKM